jgi:hypothetical protein
VGDADEGLIHRSPDFEVVEIVEQNRTRKSQTTNQIELMNPDLEKLVD